MSNSLFISKNFFSFFTFIHRPFFNIFFCLFVSFFVQRLSFHDLTFFTDVHRMTFFLFSDHNFVSYLIFFIYFFFVVFCGVALRMYFFFSLSQELSLEQNKNKYLKIVISKASFLFWELNHKIIKFFFYFVYYFIKDFYIKLLRCILVLIIRV